MVRTISVLALVLLSTAGCKSNPILPWNWQLGDVGPKPRPEDSDSWVDMLMQSGEAASTALIVIGSLTTIIGIILVGVALYTRTGPKAAAGLAAFGIGVILTGSITKAIAPIVVIAVSLTIIGAVVMLGLWLYRQYIRENNGGRQIHPKLETGP